MPELEKIERFAGPRESNDPLEEVEVLRKACEAYEVKRKFLIDEDVVAESFPKIFNSALIEDYQSKPQDFESELTRASPELTTSLLIDQTVFNLNDAYSALEKSLQQHESYITHLKVRLAALTSQKACAQVNNKLDLVENSDLEEAKNEVEAWKSSLSDVLFEIHAYQQGLNNFYEETVVNHIADGDADKLSTPCERYHAIVGGVDILGVTVDGNNCPDPRQHFYSYLRCTFGLDY